MTPERRFHVLPLAVAVVLAACATPDRLRAPPLPSSSRDAGAPVEASVEIRKLTVFDESRPVTVSPGLAERLTDYLRACNGLSASAAGVTSVPAGVASLALEVAAEVQGDRRRTWALDVVAAVTLGLFPLTPEWGTERVMLSTTALGPDGAEVWHHQVQAEVPYETWVYSWFRAEPAQQALTAAWSQAFTALSNELCERQVALLASARATPGKATAAPPPAGATAPPQARKLAKIVVLPPRAGTLAQGRTLRNWVGFLRGLVASLEATRHFQLATIEDVGPILGRDRERELATCADSSCAVEVGSTLGADYVLTTIVDVNDNGWHAVKVTVLDMKAGAVLGPVAGGRLMLDDVAAPLARDLAALLAPKAEAVKTAAGP
jgi:hypothetical protein